MVEASGYLLNGLLVALVAVSAYTDQRFQRIRNAHTFPAMGLGLLLHGISSGWSGVGFAAAGIVAGLLGLMLFYAIGVMKAGDVKLAMALGAFCGPWEILRAVILSFILFLPVGILTLALRGRLKQVWAALRSIARWLYTSLHPALEREALSMAGATLAPFGLSLGAAALLVHFLDWVGGERFFG